MSTQLHQLDRLLDAREAEPDLGFMTRLMMLCSLPRTDPGTRTYYKRINGPYQLYIQAGPKTKLPYGSLPRLLLAWLCTEAVQTQSRDLVLGRSLTQFMGKLGMKPLGAGRTRLRNQMIRLFNASVRLFYEGEEGEAMMGSMVASRAELWWNAKRPDEPALWESTVRLGEELFQEIIRNPVPIDMNTLKALRRSPLGLDLYLWLTYRIFSLKQPIRLSWKRLYIQFGADPAKAKDRDVVSAFRKKCLRELKKIHLVWPELNYTTAKGVLVLFPSKPVITAKEDSVFVLSVLSGTALASKLCTVACDFEEFSYT
ncbi:MAG: replication protein RepA [Dehalococcoidia bacterium]|nr:replication protein RepA [Dehalococcoidia bacterium]